MTSRRRLAARLPLVLALTVVGLGSAYAGSAIADRSPASTRVFPHRVLFPGATVRGTITVPAAGVDATPYLRARHVHQHCAVAPCLKHTPSLARKLRFVAVDPNGDRWSGTIADLEHGITLPGGQLHAHHDRTYTVKLSLPARTGNAYQNLTVSADLSWGGRDADGRQVTPTNPGTTTHLGPGRTGGDSEEGPAVLGEQYSQDGGDQSAVPDDSLPFTGFDLLVAAAVAGALLSAGVACLTAAYRRRPSRSC